MTDEEVVDQFISKCTAQGIKAPAEIREEAAKRIREIDSLLEEADRLRPERLRMISVVKALGGSLPKPKRAIPIKEDAAVEDLSQEDMNLVTIILQKIDEAPAVARTLMNACGLSVENDYKVYDLIKFLLKNGFCVRDAVTNKISKGPNWEDRPQSS